MVVKCLEQCLAHSKGSVNVSYNYRSLQSNKYEQKSFHRAIGTLRREGIRDTRGNHTNNNTSGLFRILYIFSVFVLFRSSDTL